MTTGQVVETSITVNNKSPIQDFFHPDDQTQPTFEMTPGFKPFTENKTVARGPFLESPGNFTGPKSNIQIEI